MENKEILNRLYETIKELPTTAEYNRLRNMFAEEKEKFLEKVGVQNRDELEKLTDMLEEMHNEINNQCFCEGFSIAVRLFVEATYKEERDV